MSNFAQPVFTLPKAQGPIICRLSKSWDKLRSNQRTITQPELRRALKISHTPQTITIMADHPAYATILDLGEKSVDHVARFEEMARNAKESKKGRELLALIAELLNS